MTMQKQYPPIVVVDENDNEIGLAPLEEAWNKGLYHRVVSIFVMDELGNMLLQLRNNHVKAYPHCWDQSAAGHVDEGHSYEQSAAIELKEEIGLRDLALETLGTFRLNDTFEDGRLNNQFERAYVVHVNHDVTLTPSPEEVAELRWFSPAALKAEITAKPEQFTPGLLYALQEYFPEYAPAAALQTA